ncbi:MAG TPA: PAS domain S-box protein [Rhodocyclaceae bacterium]|nr:PAS domain S-box protein [Rhodocyclaceae bacterium]
MLSCPDRALPSALAAVLDNLPATGLSRHLPILVSDRRGRILYVSEAFCDAVGYCADELIGRDYRVLDSGLHDDAFYAGIWETLHANRVWQGEIANRHKDGRLVWRDLSIFPLTGRDADDACFIGVSADITERKTAETAHRKTEGVLEQVVQSDPVPTFVINERHEIIYWNRALEALTGIAAASLIGQRQAGKAFYGEERPSLADLIVDGRIDALERYYPGRYRPSPIIPDAYEGEGFFPHLDPSGRWLTFTAAPLRDADGCIIGAIETLQDTTERKAAVESLRRSQAELEELVEKRTAELARAKAALEADIAKRQASETELLRRNAELTEVNERLRTTQEQLAQSERLASIGQLAAGVAHEINNPIGYVQSNLGTLENYLQDLFDVVAAFETALSSMPAADAATAAALALRREKDLDFLKEDVPALMAECKEGITRVRKIVADLKDFSRIDRSHEWEFADLHRGLESTLNIVNNEIKYKADVVREYGALPEVECLPSQLNQVFMNLLVNAAHAIGAERGRITVRTGIDGEGERVWIEIGDTGCGIAPEVVAHIFDPFFTTKPVGSGTGLGLSLSYGIVQKHGGNIEVASRPGHGTTFRITLPVRQTRGSAEQ